MAVLSTYGKCPVCGKQLGVTRGDMVPLHDYYGSMAECHGSWKVAR